MTTTEHIVETYYQVAQNCLTLTAFKVIEGNNRQLDVLAYDPIKRNFQHIEVSVTHSENWTANYSDEIMRTISLIKEYDRQAIKNNERNH